ncbi:apolipoprotein N-acyltransferase [Synechococcus sp. PCC 7502]|uniref:apolipoprotein N-acyltransferase n=1 Tax=Synechococcus sp. PCC 7502 TaxID=1173263 RepID=UPI00029FF332|nr:apolipoprotein N-acyltransferase [Synechococcus sp. PCC 7502]AFY74353.1 apolipoprotein N-acyltransferase [Synechococcus sp. PCC 7502]
MQNWQKIVIAATGGILMGLTPDPFSLWILAWIALVPLWLMTQQLSVRSAMLMGAVWGFCYHGMALFWITGIHPMTWLGVPWVASLAIAIGVWLFITIWGLVLAAVWAGGMAWLTPKLSGWGRIIVAIALFCTLETIWSWGALNWTALGYTQSPHNLIMLQITKLSGQQTMTAAIVGINGLLAEFIDSYAYGVRAKWRYLIVALALVLAICVYGSWSMASTADANEKALKVGIIQGNIPNPVKLKFDGIKLAVERYAQGYEKLAQSKVDMILTPETAIPILYPNSDPRRSAFDQMVEKYNIPVWMGSFGYANSPNNPYGYSNSLFLRDRTHLNLAQYNKVRLVPIGEFIPFKQILGGLIKRLSPLRGEVEAGKSDQIIDTHWGRLVVAICYESAYPSHFRYQAAAGGQLILTASNNAHYAETMPAQHHAQDVARAVESDRWAVRATNTGYSGIVDPNGRTIWISGINTYETHADTVYFRNTETPYVKFGDWLTSLFCLGAVIVKFLKL